MYVRIYIYIYTYSTITSVTAIRFFRGWVPKDRNLATRIGRTVNLRTKILDFRGFDSSRILILNSQAQREFPGKFESSNLSRDNLSREIGRGSPQQSCPWARASVRASQVSCAKIM